MNDTLRQAEAHRRKALEVRQLAYRCRSIHEREAFQRLAHGYDVLAGQLEEMSRPKDEIDGMERRPADHHSGPHVRHS